jgi:DNA-binding NarL/FixJ family response regulator
MPEPPSAYRLTGRELAALRLPAAGCTHARIGAEFYISHKTISVHVSNKLHKTRRARAGAGCCRVSAAGRNLTMNVVRVSYTTLL